MPAKPPFDSLFEQRVHNRIVDRGYTVIPQYEAVGYRIDLVVVGGRTRLAVECDGDEWHGPGAFERDLARQRELERCGWRFFRIRESAFYVDPAAALGELWEALRDLDIYAAGELTDPASEDDGGLASPIATPESEEAVTETTVRNDPAPSDLALSGPTSAELEREVASVVAIPEPSGPREFGGENGSSPGPSISALEPYEEFSCSVSAVSEVTRSQLVDGLREIVAMEGPMLGERLQGVYVRASGGQRVGKEIARTLNSAISAAVQRGVLVMDDPLGEPGVKPRTYRLPDQPIVRVRQLGPRSVHQVPPAELAALMALAARDYGWEESDAIMRATLDLLGMRRFTRQIHEHLEPVLNFARSQYES